MSEETRSKNLGQIFKEGLLLMNYPYSSLIFEAQRANQELARLFQAQPDRCATSLSQSNIGRASAKNDPQGTANRPRISPELWPPRDILSGPRTNTRFPSGTYWMREDMGILSFTLTLVLLSTVAAAQTDRPMLWLLAGPAPLAVGFAAVAFLRRRFNLCAYLRGLRHRGWQRGDRSAHRGSCQCQCQ